MSTPAGQSLAQALQDRHRSSDSCTAGSRQSRISRAVGQFLQHPGPAAGDVLLVPGRPERRAHEATGGAGVGPALADADAPVHARTSGRRRRRRRRTRRPAAGVGRPAGAGRRPAGPGRTSTPGLSRSSGSNSALDLRRTGRSRRASTSAAAARRGPGRRRARRSSDPPCADDQPGRVQHERAERRGAPVEREVDADVHAAVAEVPVRHAGQTGVEPAAPRTRAGRRRAGRAGRRRPPSRARPAGRRGCVRPARAVGADPPQRGRRRAGGQHHGVDGATVPRPSPAARWLASAAESPPTSTISQPPPRGSSGTACAPRARRRMSTIRASSPSTACGRCASSAGTASAACAMDG